MINDELQWIEDAAAGDMAAFRKLYERYLREVTCTVGRYLGPGPEVEEVVQEVFVELHRSLARVSDPSAFGGWVQRVARNVAISHLRKRPTSVDFVALKNLKEPTSLWQKLQTREKLRTLYSAMESLSQEQREAIIMYEIEGNTLQEIAETTESSINTVASRVRRGRENLVKLIRRLQSPAESDATPAPSKEGTKA